MALNAKIFDVIRTVDDAANITAVKAGTINHAEGSVQGSNNPKTAIKILYK